MPKLTTAQIFYLSTFIEAREENDFPFLPSDLWLICLGENPYDVTKLFKKLHLIIRSGLFCRIDRKYTKSQLKEIVKQFGVEHFEGTKKELILSLVPIDTKKAENLVADFDLFECSEEGRKTVDAFLKLIGSNEAIRRGRSRLNASSLSNFSKIFISLAAGGIIGNKADKAFDILGQTLRKYLKHGIDSDKQAPIKSGEQKIPSFRSYVCLTYSNEDNKFIEFLEKNYDKLVYIDSTFDFSTALKIQEIAVERLNIPIGKLMDGEVNGELLPIPRNEKELTVGCFQHIIFYKTPQTRFIYSGGGLGVRTMKVRGFFEVYCGYYSGPSQVYYLTEVYVPFSQKWQALREVE